MKILYESEQNEVREFPISTDSIEEVDKKLKKLQSKAAAYGNSFSYSFSSPFPFEVKVYDPDTNQKVSEYVVEAVNVTVKPEIIKKGDYKVIALIEHTEAGNVVTPTSDEPVRKEWYSIPSNCDHCHVNRFRLKTFMVKEISTGKELQIGRSCLKDYTGIAPEGLVFPYVLLGSLKLTDELSSNDTRLSSISKAYYPSYIIGLAIENIEKYGYVRKDSANSTFERVRADIEKDKKLDSGTEQKVKEITDFVKSYNGSDDIILNAQTLVNGGVCKFRHIGRLVYLPLAVKRDIENTEKQKKRDEEQKKSQETSNYVGNVGDKVTVEVKEAKYITSWEGAYGTTHLYKFWDKDGNVLTWFASKLIEVSPENVKKITGTVKAQEEYQGVKQTVLTRVKVI